MKSLFDRKARERDFKEGDLVIRWHTGREDKGKNGKFDDVILCVTKEIGPQT